MLAPKKLPESFKQWNRRWKAPHGRRGRIVRSVRFSRGAILLRGPFGFQPNNSIRAFEFPWAYFEATKEGTGLRVVEIGGGVSGLQYILAKEGHNVTNVDPGLHARGKGWEVDSTLHEEMGRMLRAPVKLMQGTLGSADFEDESVDVYICVSVLEHLTDLDLQEISGEIHRTLKRSGIVVCTADLFLDISPFTDKSRNQYGRNIDIAKLLCDSGLVLESGREEQLVGYDTFDYKKVLENLSDYMIGTGYPALSQCFTARKRQA